MNSKKVFTINGEAGAGKDTICTITGKYYNIKCISAITPIFPIAYAGGWDGIKDEPGRQLLAALRSIFCKYNDLSNRYLQDEYMNFLNDACEMLFVQIREPDQIKKFLEYVSISKYTLLIKRNLNMITYNNSADKNVDNFKYDIIFNNTYETIEEYENMIVKFWKVFLDEGFI